MKSQAIERYLDRVLLVADPRKEKVEEIRAELTDHLYAKAEDLVQAGVLPESAVLKTLRDYGNPDQIGYRLRERWRWIDVRPQGVARGVIAVGPTAIGVFAFGGKAIGVFTLGILSVGLFPIGFISIGLLAFRIIAFGGYTLASYSFGVIAYGAFSVGLISAGSFTVGTWSAWAEHLPPLLLQGPNRSLSYLAPYLAIFYLLMIALCVGVRFREWHRLHCSNETDWRWR